jgi:hypothetical protein
MSTLNNTKRSVAAPPKRMTLKTTHANYEPHESFESGDSSGIASLVSCGASILEEDDRISRPCTSSDDNAGDAGLRLIEDTRRRRRRRKRSIIICAASRGDAPHPYSSPGPGKDRDASDIVDSAEMQSPPSPHEEEAPAVLCVGLSDIVDGALARAADAMFDCMTFGMMEDACRESCRFF